MSDRTPDRVALSGAQSILTASAAGYIRDMAAQLAEMADQSCLPTTAVALRLASLLMSEEHEVLAPGEE